MKRLYNFVTTFHSGHKHGFEMVKSWLKNVDHQKTNAILHVYYEGDIQELEREVGWTTSGLSTSHKGFIMTDTYHTGHGHSHFAHVMKPHQDKFVTAPTNSLEYDSKLMFKMDAIRFAHKIFALDTQMLQHERDWETIITNYVGWIDADTIVHSEIPENFFDTITDPEKYMSYLSRTERHSECGFLLFNTKHRFHRSYWKHMRNMYERFWLLHEKEWHDSYLFDVVRKTFNQDEFIKIHEIDKGDVFGQSVLGKYMTHYKGPQTVGK